MNLTDHLNKNNLHHAYLIEGGHEEIVPEILEFLEDIGVKTVGNSDFLHVKFDSLKIDDARDLKSYGNQKSFSDRKKFFLVTANNILLEAQNSLLKMFEEPIENTHFFIIIPDANVLLPTFISRFYSISTSREVVGEAEEIERFLALSLSDRIQFMKDLLIEDDDEDEDGNEKIVLNSARAKALKFLNDLEYVLHHKILNKNKVQENSAVFTLPGAPGGSYAAQNFPAPCFEHLFKVRELLRMPGSSAKSLMESVALIVPDFSK